MHLNMSYSDVRSLPVRYRAWFIERLSSHFEQKNNPSKNQPSKSDMKSLSEYEQMLDKKFK